MTDTIPSPSVRKVKHYKVICISIYNEDLSNLDRMVEELKELRPRVSRSSLIRYALRNVDVTRVEVGDLR